MSKKYTFIDLFAGCGGLSEGFLMSGYFEALAHVEWELPMVNTLRNRLEKKWGYNKEETKKTVIHFDIQKTDELINGNWSEKTKNVYADSNHKSIIQGGIKKIVKNKTVDLIIGGPPCQAYSIAGRAQDKNSMRDDYRNYLFESFVKVVDEFKPKLFVFENVPGMLSAKPGGKKVTERVYEAFSKIGYEISTSDNLKNNIYSADDFGVPQKRRRLIIIGVHKSRNIDLQKIYNAIQLQKSKTKKFVGDVLRGLPEFMPLKKSIRVNGKNISHNPVKSAKLLEIEKPRFHNERDIKIFRKWIDCNMNNKPMNEKINFYNEIMNKNSKHVKYRNLEWDKPSPTIVAHIYKDGLMFIHPDKNQARSITVREAALLQSFPIDFEFIGSKGYCYKMIGNAVPPKLAREIALGIVKFLK